MKLALILWLAHTLPQPVADPMCLATTIYLEARGQPELGQRAIAEVVLRRRDSGHWGDSVCDVVTARGQFAMSLLSPNQRLREPVAAMAALRIAGNAMARWPSKGAPRDAVVPGANSFGTLGDAAGHRIVRVIGDHAFWRSGSIALR